MVKKAGKGGAVAQEQETRRLNVIAKRCDS